MRHRPHPQGLYTPAGGSGEEEEACAFPGDRPPVWHKSWRCPLVATAICLSLIPLPLSTLLQPRKTFWGFTKEQADSPRTKESPIILEQVTGHLYGQQGPSRSKKKAAPPNTWPWATQSDTELESECAQLWDLDTTSQRTAGGQAEHGPSMLWRTPVKGGLSMVTIATSCHTVIAHFFHAGVSYCNLLLLKTHF